MKSKKNPLSTNLYHIYILSIVIPTMAIAIFVFSVYRKQYIEQQSRDIKNILHTTTFAVMQILDDMRTANESSYISSQAFNALPIFINPSLEVDQLRLNSIEKNYEEILYKTMFGRTNDIESLSFFPYFEGETRDPCFIVSRASEGIFKNNEYSYYDKQWYTNIKNNIEPESVIYAPKLPDYLEEFYLSNFATISIATEIKNLNTGNPLGIMKADLRVSRITKKLTEILLAENSFIFIADKNETIISVSKPLSLFAKYYFENQESSIIHFYNVFSQEIPNTPFSVYYMTGISDSILTLVFSILFVIVLIIVETEVGLSIYRQKSKKIVKSINSILATMESYSNGALEARAERSSVDYIDSFVLSLNKMAEKLQNMINKEYLAVINKQKAEYKALQSQINPHFFYNTLNGFVALNRMGETKKLEKSIISLTKLFRYTCANTEYVSVKDECDFVKEYLKLQKIKYEERLEYQFDVSVAAQKVYIPRLILQPLVENSVVHGLEPVSRTVTIKIMAQIVNQNLIIKVVDDGEGCTPEDLQFNKSIALENIQRRIEIFAKGSKLVFQCQNTKGVAISLCLPLNEEAEL